MARRLPFKVRVKQTIESWVDVEALDEAEAERLAANLPNVAGVFLKSAVRADKPVGRDLRVGVEDE